MRPAERPGRAGKAEPEHLHVQVLPRGAAIAGIQVLVQTPQPHRTAVGSSVDLEFVRTRICETRADLRRQPGADSIRVAISQTT